jgi:Ca2+-binding EF-hand superfamily protein
MALSGASRRNSLQLDILIDAFRLSDYFHRTMKLILPLFPVLLLASCATTSAPSPEQKFKRADKDGNGMVSRTEATNLMIADAFAMYDANGDGLVTEAEFVASGGKPQNFRKVNASGSGKITLAEAQSSPLVFNTFVVSFDEADVNKDGQVTLAEYKSYIALRDAAVR